MPDVRDPVVIGIGSDYRRDDGVGLVVSRAIADRKLERVRVISGIAEGTRLIEAWENARAAFVIDCVSSGGKPGEIFRFDALNEALPERIFSNHSTHCFSVTSTIELARVLKRLPHKLIVYGIEGGDFSSGEGLSAVVAEAAETVACSIAAEVDWLAVATQLPEHET